MIKKRKERRDSAIILEWTSNPKESLRGLGDRFDLSYEAVRKILIKRLDDYKKYSPQSNRTLQYDTTGSEVFHEELHNYIQQFKCVPNQNEWDAYAKKKDGIPRSTYLTDRFDSWFDFISPVAICYHDRCLCQSKNATYSDDELLDILKDIADILGHAPTYQQIDEMTPSNLRWIDFYERFGRFSDVWDALEIDYPHEHQARGQDFRYSNNRLFKWLCKGYDDMGSDLEKKWFEVRDEAPHPKTFERRLSGCWWSVLCMVDRYGDVDNAQDWDKSKLFMYHFNGEAYINAGSLPDAIRRDDFSPKKGGQLESQRFEVDGGKFQSIVEKRNHVRDQLIGDEVDCPICGDTFIKKRYNHMFCSNHLDDNDKNCLSKWKVIREKIKQHERST